MAEHELDEDVVYEDAEELREGSSEAGADLERLETLERHGMLTRADDQNALQELRGNSDDNDEDDDDASE
jgi:hypothetical protein